MTNNGLIRKQVLEFMKAHFNAPVLEQQMRWTLKDSWLTVEYHESLTAQDCRNPKNWKWSLVCAQDINDYIFYATEFEPTLERKKLLDRIHIIMFESIRSKQQDVNIFMTEYDCYKKKGLCL